MNFLLKFSLLFGLILAGRYLQSTATLATGIQRKPALSFFASPTPSLIRYTTYADTTFALPVSHRKPVSLTLY